MKNKKGTGAGTGFCGLLTIALILLKLLGYISISWFWVFSPLVAGIIIDIVIIIVAIILVSIFK